MATNFDDIVQKAKEVGGIIADKSVDLYRSAEIKTKQLAKIAVLNKDVTFAKNDLKRLYTELGEKYYEEKKFTPDLAFQQQITEISMLLDKIETLKNEIDEVKSADAEDASYTEDGADGDTSYGEDSDAESKGE